MVTRSPFRAKLRKPKDELWLGCIIKSKRSWISKNGDQWLTIGFENCPLFATFTSRDFERKGELPMIGDVVNVEFHWHEYYDGRWTPMITPYGRFIL